MKPASRDIEEHRGIAAHGNPRQNHIEGDERESAVPPPAGEPAMDIRRVQKPPRAILIDGRDRIDGRTADRRDFRFRTDDFGLIAHAWVSVG